MVAVTRRVPAANATASNPRAVAGNNSNDPWAVVVNANKRWNEAEATGDKGREAVRNATRDFYLAVASVGAAGGHTADDVIRLRLKPKADGTMEDMPKDRTLITRRHEWNVVLTAGALMPDVFSGAAGIKLWDETLKGVRGMSKVCEAIIQTEGKLDAAGIQTAAKASEQTNGDLISRAISSLDAINDEGDDEAQEFVDACVNQLSHIASVFAKMRTEGKLKTGAELKREALGIQGRTGKRSMLATLGARASA